jgi:hypothetical protein
MKCSERRNACPDPRGSSQGEISKRSVDPDSSGPKLASILYKTMTETNKLDLLQRTGGSGQFNAARSSQPPTLAQAASLAAESWEPKADFNPLFLRPPFRNLNHDTMNAFLLFLPTANCQLPTANCQLPTANSQLPTANCQLYFKSATKNEILRNSEWVGRSRPVGKLQFSKGS